ncbi:EF-hand domain-containing protein [Brevundimonas variabilis]|uniref:Ca2+-binding EF-hand superfamily protein n=1 Tax=Brevundimonas variabilis TaxID=74312 RepID=A0A7W9CFD9_9CAUL|nr:EF-hand domain-containing protein [Brevundimonas variabilis]MBB5744638.1 Ca2+-binding EF-hand superfamily protein [Brevundimonas variabilis]
MKKTMMIGGAAALALSAAVGGAALAQQAPAERSPARADANRDGQITRAEFVDARVQRLKAIDTDGDGTITRAERAGAKQARRAERLEGRFDRLDTDRNGAISRTEFQARPERGGRGPGADRMGRGGPRGERMAARREARGPLVIAEAEARATEAFARMDANSDGAVTVAERRAARQQMRQVRQERRAERVARRAAPGSQTQSPPTPGSE